MRENPDATGKTILNDLFRLSAWSRRARRASTESVAVGNIFNATRRRDSAQVQSVGGFAQKCEAHPSLPRQTNDRRNRLKLLGGTFPLRIPKFGSSPQAPISWPPTTIPPLHSH